MPWIKLHAPLDCAVCGQPSGQAHVTERPNPLATALFGVPLTNMWVEARCKEHAYRLNVKGRCNHGGRIEGDRPYVVPSCKTDTPVTRITTKERVTYVNYTRTAPIDDRHNRRH